MIYGRLFPRKGFSSAVALLILATLLLIAIAASALLRLRLAESSVDFERTVRRREARALLKVALGELQSAVGPDCRTSAEASLVNEPGKPEIAPARWIGVWRTDRLRNEPPGIAPFVHRDPVSGALIDDRYRHVGRDFDRSSEVLRWLVSGGDMPEAAKRTEDRLTLLSAEGDEPAVNAPAVKIPGTGDVFAWWASDEGVKARPGYRPASAHPGVSSDRGDGADLIPGWLRPGELPAIRANGLSDLEAGGYLSPGAASALRHDLTTDSVGLLTDTRDGGFRRDLTSFLFSNGKTGEIRDDTPLLGAGPGIAPFAVAGPRFGMLRAWAGIGAAVAKNGRLPVSPGSRHRDPDTGKPADRFHDGTHPDLPESLAPVAPVIAPVMSEAAVYVRLGCDPDRRNKDGAPWLRLHLHPRVALWNPYAATLAPARYLVHLRINGSPQFQLTGAKGRLTGAISGWRVYDNAKVNYATTQGTLLFVIDCPAIPAGESRVFLPARTAPLYGKAASTKNFDPSANVLVESRTPTNANFYLEDYDAFEDAGLRALTGVSLAGERWRCENSAAEDFAMSLSLLPAGHPTDWKGLRDMPVLRYAGVSVKIGSGTTPVAGWGAGRDVPLEPDFDAPPPAGSRDGIRLRRFDEPAANRALYSPAGYGDIAPLGDFNPPAPLSGPHPFENLPPPSAAATGRKPELFGLYTRDAPDEATEPAALTPVAGVTSHPFGTPKSFPGAGSVVVAGFPVAPGRVTSPADFSDAPLSSFAWAPSRAAGESAITPVVPRDASFHVPRAADWTAIGSGGHTAADFVRLAESPASPRVFDLRYEVNHALWDGFCWLTGDAGQRERFSADPYASPLPNTDLIPAGAGVPADALTGEKASFAGPASLGVEGALNVNSVSVIAWTQWLARLRGLNAEGKPDSGARDKTGFGRFPGFATVPVDSAPEERNPALGSGLRRLSDAELRRLAGCLVVEVRRRGPFLSLSDFINRRLSDEPVAIRSGESSFNACGALEAAIERAGLNNASDASRVLLARSGTLPGTRYLAEQKSRRRTAGFAGVISQADLLKSGGASLSARSDTFRLRLRVAAAGGGAGGVTLEALVQRLPEPLIVNSGEPPGPDKKTAGPFGRRLVITRIVEIAE